MNTPRICMHRLRFLIATALPVLGFLLCPSTSRATLLTSWTQYSGSTSSGLNSSSPVLGNNTTNSADSQSIYALAGSTSTLSGVGDSITFSGSATFTNLASAQADQFRFGLYNTNGNATGTNTGKGWLGYFADNAGAKINGTGTTFSQIWERSTALFSFGSGSGATSDKQVPAAVGSTFVAGTYTFSLTYTLAATGLQTSWTLVNSTPSTYSVSGSYLDTTPQTYSFDSVGIFTGSTLFADQISFSNLGLTYTAAVPEPASTAALMGLASALMLLPALRRRSRATN